ncbi:MAG: NAD(P)/FAD-dependent oxidoreductase [Muribaculaceae bacterium]|nr:NAD(P)/FAD-dependent oxidoreductase [Muribaculaceae bacterium]
MCKKRVIIIGSGLGGLSCGVILAKNGYHVTVLEQSPQIGGCLQCFNRRGAKFETGMHFIGSVSPGQTLDRLMNYLEIKPDVVLSQLDPMSYDVVAIDGERFAFANGREAFLEQLSARFPAQRDNLAKYYDLIEKVSGASSLHSLKYAESDAAINTEYQLRSINEVIDELITDPLLARVLVGNLPLYAAEKDKTPFSTHAFIMDFYNQSAYRFAGGSDTVAISLRRTIERYGGEVRTMSKATRILCDDTHATGVEVNASELLQADYVISDAHPMRTLELIDSKLIRPAFRNRINAIPQTVGGFSVYLEFKENALPYMNSNFYGYNYGTPWDCEKYDDATWPRGYLYMHLCHKPHPRFAQTGVILSYMHMSDVEQWQGTRVGHRGEDYEQFKQDKAERLISSLERYFPNLRDSIKHYYTSTPLTYLDYTGTQEGSMYGIAKDVTLGVGQRVPHRTRIPNVYQTGQNINSHGMLGVLVGTIVTCSEFITAKTIYQQIIDSN